MELVEPIDKINELLVKEFGREFNNMPRFRVVFSDDEFEKRWTDRTDEGFQLLNREVRLLPKYKQYITAKYILERLIPIVGETDLTTNINYEPAWVFQDKNGGYLPPQFDMCKFIVETLYSQMNGRQSGFAKYKDPNTTTEEREKLIADMQDRLFGDETAVTDALTHGYGVTDFNQKVNFGEG